MRILLMLMASAALCGCATQQSMQWSKVRPDAQDLAQVAARCDYETAAATQGTDYSFRSSLGQELDRAIRKRDLEQKCMLANGYALVPVINRTPEQQASAARYRGLDDQLQQTKDARAGVRAALSSAPGAADAAQLSNRIAELNRQVFELETQLGYVKSAPLSTEPTAVVSASK